ncbi:MAG: aspartate-semialdehyde dehydrogenase, partial [Gallionella sp.]|nr:aspartate-semialdehyde dehydrogenase [Gallionella sp.]
MSKQYDVCILGATGAVGEAMLSILEQRKFPVRNLYPLASSRSAGSPVTFTGKEITVIDVEGFDFSKTQIGLFSAGGSVSEKYAPL